MDLTYNTVAATCTKIGLTEGKHCPICNKVIIAQMEIPALGHEFVNYVYNNDATTIADGTESATCEYGCGSTDTRVAEGTKIVMTAVSKSVTDNLLIYSHYRTIIVENATNEILVYNTSGLLISYVGVRKTMSKTIISINDAGIYIVKTGHTVKRVMIK